MRRRLQIPSYFSISLYVKDKLKSWARNEVSIRYQTSHFLVQLFILRLTRQRPLRLVNFSYSLLHSLSKLFLLVSRDQILMLKSQADVIQPLEQELATVLVKIKVQL